MRCIISGSENRREWAKLGVWLNVWFEHGKIYLYWDSERKCSTCHRNACKGNFWNFRIKCILLTLFVLISLCFFVTLFRVSRKSYRWSYWTHVLASKILYDLDQPHVIRFILHKSRKLGLPISIFLEWYLQFIKDTQ